MRSKVGVTGGKPIEVGTSTENGAVPAGSTRVWPNPSRLPVPCSSAITSTTVLVPGAGGGSTVTVPVIWLLFNRKLQSAELGPALQIPVAPENVSGWVTVLKPVAWA